MITIIMFGEYLGIGLFWCRVRCARCVYLADTRNSVRRGQGHSAVGVYTSPRSQGGNDDSIRDLQYTLHITAQHHGMMESPFYSYATDVHVE